MSRLKEKITPSLRAALEKIGDNVETIPDPDSPHFLPRWDFSQSTDRINVTLYVKTPDPTMSYCEQLPGGGFLLFACYGWHKRIVSLTIPDFHEAILEGTGVLTMTPNKLEITLRKESASEITWPRLWASKKPTVKHEGIMNPEPPRPPTIEEPIVEEPEEEEEEKLQPLETYHSTGGMWEGVKKSDKEKSTAEQKKQEAAKNIAKGQMKEEDRPEYDTEEEAELIAKELARLPADMRKRVKVVFKEGEDDSDSSLDGVENVDWVESSDAKELMKGTAYVNEQMNFNLNEKNF